MSTLAESADAAPVGTAPPVAGSTAAAGGFGTAARWPRVRAYVSMTKPRIVELLLITTVPAMMLAARGLPSWSLMAVVVIGGALAAGAANAINCYLDRDIDPLMRRTSKRPLATHSVPASHALIFGLVLAAVAIGLMAAFTNVLATALTLGAIVYYDLVYTRWLKRRTAWNTFWGGVCGAAPVLIGWAAVTGGLAVEAWVLFAVVFFWQMPHFYALAVRFADDYARAGVPMLPVVASPRRVGVETVIFTWLTVAASLLLWPLSAGGGAGMSAVSAVPAAVCGAMFVAEAHGLAGRLRGGGRDVAPMRLFHWSSAYLTIVFVAIAVDVFV